MDDSRTAEDLKRALDVAIEELDQARYERDQAKEATQALQEGKPLGEIAGKHMIQNQQRTIERLNAENDRLKKALKDEDISHANSVDQRDRAEAAADWLAQAIMAITGQDIGEHSSANCPWRNGIAMAEEYAGEREKLQARISRLSEALHQALIHWGGHGVPPEEGSAYQECETRLEESLEDARARTKPEPHHS